MASIEPTTRSPGFLVLFYTFNGAEHRCAVRFSAGMDIMNFIAVTNIANALAPLVTACMPPTMSISRFEVHDTDHSYLWGGNTSSTFVGTHGTNPSLLPYKSTTVALTGKAIPITPGNAVGQLRITFRTSNAYVFDPGTKRIVRDAALNALATYLTNQVLIWADYYGQHGLVRTGATVQFNAHVQRVEGT